MENKSNESTPQRPEGNRIIDAPLVNLDLNEYKSQIKNEKAWIENDRNAITLFKSNGLRLVLIALHKDAEMAKHSAKGMITVQVMEGLIRFSTDEQSVELSTGKMIVLHEGIPHSVLAIEESTFLLTLIESVSSK